MVPLHKEPDVISATILNLNLSKQQHHICKVKVVLEILNCFNQVQTQDVPRSWKQQHLHLVE